MLREARAERGLGVYHSIPVWGVKIVEHYFGWGTLRCCWRIHAGWGSFALALLNVFSADLVGG